MDRLTDTFNVPPRFSRLRADRSVHALAAARVKDPRLRMALSFHPLFIGGDPFNVTSIYALVCHLEKAFGVHYAIGGVQAIADAMVRVIRSQGDIVIQGVEVDGQRMEAGLVVSNADAGHTYTRLLRNMPKRRWSPARLARQRWSMGLFVWYFGTRGTAGKWADVGHHTILNGPRYKGLAHDIFMRGHLPDDMSLYLHRPSVTDPGVAPDGGDTFYALSPVPHLGHANPVDWAREAQRYRAKVAARLEEVIPGFQSALSESMMFTPEDFRDGYLSPYGSGFSIKPRILQSAWFRPHNVSE